MAVGIDVITLEYLNENAWVIGIVAVVSILLAYICSYMIKRNFYGDGMKAGRGF